MAQELQTKPFENKQESKANAVLGIVPLHPETAVADEKERSLLSRFTAYKEASSDSNDVSKAYNALLSKLKESTLSPAALFCFANACYGYWQQQWLDQEQEEARQRLVSTHQAYFAQHAAGRTLFRSTDQPTQYYWASLEASGPDDSKLTGVFLACYPLFQQGETGNEVGLIRAVTTITSPTELKHCQEHTREKEREQYHITLWSNLSLVCASLVQQGPEATLIMNLQLAQLCLNKGYVNNAGLEELSKGKDKSCFAIFKPGHAVYYLKQALSYIATLSWKEVAPPKKLKAAATALRDELDTTLISQLHTRLFEPQATLLSTQLYTLFENFDQSSALAGFLSFVKQSLQVFTNFPLVSIERKKILLLAIVSKLHQYEGSDPLRLKLNNALSTAKKPGAAQKQLLSLTKQILSIVELLHPLVGLLDSTERHPENYALFLLQWYEQRLVDTEKDLDKNSRVSGPYQEFFQQTAKDNQAARQQCSVLYERLHSSSRAASVAAPPLPTITPSDWSKREAELAQWRQDMVKALADEMSIHLVHAANTDYAKRWFRGLCAEVEAQLGPAPCAFAITVSGSCSRGEVSPLSDVDFQLLIQDANAKHHPYFEYFLELLLWKAASMPNGVLALERQNIKWLIEDDLWVGTPQEFIKKHIFLPVSGGEDPWEPENFNVQWLVEVYPSHTQADQAKLLWADYQCELERFLKPANAPASYPQLGAICFQHKIASLPKDEIEGDGSPLSATAKAGLKSVLFPITNTILCLARFTGAINITETQALLKHLEKAALLPPTMLIRIRKAVTDLHSWRCRAHLAQLQKPWPAQLKGQHDSVFVWPDDSNLQALLKQEPRECYLDQAETERLNEIRALVIDTLVRSVEGFMTYASQIPAMLNVGPTPADRHLKDTADEAKQNVDGSSLLSSSYTTTSIPEVKEAKREVTEEEAQAIIVAQSRDIAEAKAPAPSPTTTAFNPLVAAVEWTLQQLKNKSDSKTPTAEVSDKSRTEHVHWLAYVVSHCTNEIPSLDPIELREPVRAKQDPMFHRHWQVYWQVPPQWRSLYIDRLRQHLDPDTIRRIIKPLRHAPNQVGWRLVTQEQQSQWQRSLRSLLAQDPLPNLPEAAEADIAAGKAVWVQWIENHQSVWAPLKPEHAEVLLASDAKSTRWQPKTNTTGNHRVYCLKEPAGYFWAKIYPEQPGTGHLIASLEHRLDVDRVPQQQTMALHHAPLTVKDGTAAGITITRSAIVISEHVADQSQNLQTVLEKQPQLLAKLDFIAFIKTLLRVLLTNPEDDKADDYFLVPIRGTGRYRLIRIDNERAFLPVNYFSKGWLQRQEELHVKSIVYCLDQMLIPWDKDPRVVGLLDDLRQLQPSSLIIDLLQEIDSLHADWQQLFPLETIHQHACLQEPWMSLPTPLLPQGIESVLLKRFTSLQTALRSLELSKLNGLKLIAIVQHELAKFYNDSLFQGKLAPDGTLTNRHANARFEQVAGRYYKQQPNHAGGRTTRMTGTMMLSRLSSIVLPEQLKTSQEREQVKTFAQNVWEKKTNSVAQALAAVEHWRHEEGARVAENLLANKTDPAETARIREKARIQFELLPGPEQQRVLEKVLPTSGTTLTSQEQLYLLAVLVGAQCHNLDLSPFKAILTNELLLPILRNANKQILKLNLSGCTQLTPDILKDIERYCPHLKRLRMNFQRYWTKITFGDFANLMTIECEHATLLTQLRFGALPKLRRLSLAGATALRELVNVVRGQGTFRTSLITACDLPKLQRLDISGCRELIAIRVITQQLEHLRCDWLGCKPQILIDWMQFLSKQLIKDTSWGVDELIATAIPTLDLSIFLLDKYVREIGFFLLRANIPITRLEIMPKPKYSSHALGMVDDKAAHPPESKTTEGVVPGDICSIKIVLAGPGLGKSSLMTRFVSNYFPLESPITIGAAFSTKTVTLNDGVVKFQIWDTANQEFTSTLDLVYRASGVIFLCFGITDEDYFRQLESFMPAIERSGALKLLVGLRADLNHKRTVSHQSIQSFADKYGGIPYFECSAKTGVGVTKLFLSAALLAISQRRYISRTNIKAALEAQNSNLGKKLIEVLKYNRTLLSIEIQLGLLVSKTELTIINQLLERNRRLANIASESPLLVAPADTSIASIPDREIKNGLSGHGSQTAEQTVDTSDLSGAPSSVLMPASSTTTLASQPIPSVPDHISTCTAAPRIHFFASPTVASIRPDIKSTSSVADAKARDILKEIHALLASPAAAAKPESYRLYHTQLREFETRQTPFTVQDRDTLRAMHETLQHLLTPTEEGMQAETNHGVLL